MSTTFLNGIDLNNQKLTGLASGTLDSDGATWGQVQGLLRGLEWKNSVRACATGNLTLSGTQTVDGVALIAGDRVLAPLQTTASASGIYVVAAGAWTRATDFDDSTEVTAAAAIPIEEGTANADSVQILTTHNPIVIGTTALTFTRLGGSGTTYTAGTNGGLVLSSSAFSILLDTASGLLLGAGGIKIDRTVAGSRPPFATNVPTNASAAIVHNFGTLDVHVEVWRVSDGALVWPDIVKTDTNTVTLGFPSAPSSGQYRCVVSA